MLCRWTSTYRNASIFRVWRSEKKHSRAEILTQRHNIASHKTGSFRYQHLQVGHFVHDFRGENSEAVDSSVTHIGLHISRLCGELGHAICWMNTGVLKERDACTVCLLSATDPSTMNVRVYRTYRNRKDVRDVWCTEVDAAVEGHILRPWLMQATGIFARIGDLLPNAFGVLPDAECGVISVWYTDSTDTAACSAVECTVAACSFELDFDRPGKIFAVKDNNFKLPNSLAYFYKISTIMTRLRSGWFGVRIPRGARIFLLLNVHSGSGAHLASYSIGTAVFFSGILFANAKK